jgi:hypothetical protein
MGRMILKKHKEKAHLAVKKWQKYETNGIFLDPFLECLLEEDIC